MATRLQRLRRTPAAETFPLAGPGFRRAAPWLLLSVMLVGLATRLHPAFRYAIWGSDSGEYYFLTEQLVDTGRIIFDYEGWGIAYPYFPGMFLISGAAHAVLGVDLATAVQFTTPMLGALIPVFIGLFAYRLTSDPRAGMVAGTFAAITAPIVITTSHAMPGTLGQVFMLLLLVLLPDSFRDKRHWPILVLAGGALVLTHHLTTYFAIGVIAFASFAREILSRTSERERLFVEIPLVGYLLGLAIIWWMGVAAPFREQIVGDALNLHPAVTAALFLTGLALLPLAVWARRRWTPWVPLGHYPSFPRQARAVGIVFLGIGSLIAIFVMTKVPGTDIRLTWSTLFYVLPVLGFVAFLPLGAATIRFHRHGLFALGWLWAILGSLVFSIVTNNHVLFPFRHIDYMVMAMAPLVAVGMLMAYDQMMAQRVPSERGRVRTILVLLFIALLTTSTVFSLPPRETLGGFEEGTTHAEMAAVRWATNNLPPGTTMAADHRISSLVWGYGSIHATWDEAYVTYHSETAQEAISDLANLRSPIVGPTRIDYVFLSPVIEEGVTLLQWETSAPMSQAAIVKFRDPRFFEPVYDDQGVQIVRVKWEQIAATPEDSDGAAAQRRT